MRKALIRIKDVDAGILEELNQGKYQFAYYEDYKGLPVSLTMPLTQKIYEYDKFPPFFEGLLPEGTLLDALLRKFKLDKHDYFGQLLIVGEDVVGAVTIKEIS